MSLLRAIVTFALLLMISGAHWGALQTIAWTRMAVVYSVRSGLREGIQQTFDGKHPCALCSAIKKAKPENRTEPGSLAAPSWLPEWLGVASETPASAVAPEPVLVSVSITLSDGLTRRPPTPPPRNDCRS